MSESFSEKTLREFVEQLGSKSPIPGGGGAAALVGAIGTALGNMVASLTIGKPKYKEFENDLIGLQARADTLQQEFLLLVQKDAEAFEPLAAAYKVGPGDEMESALKTACDVPLTIMRKCADTIELCSEFAEKGSKIVISDAGAGVILSKAAMQAASLSVFINTGAIQDKKYASQIEEQANKLLDKYLPLADSIFLKVKGKL